MTIREPGVVYSAGYAQYRDASPRTPDTFRLTVDGIRWGDERLSLPQNLSSVWRYYQRPAAIITHLIIHHSAGSPRGTARQFASYHTQSKGWPGIGYHFVVRPGAVVYTGDILTTRFHGGACNPYSIGVCVPGNYERDAVSDELLWTLRTLRTYLMVHLGTVLRVGGHRDYMSTACPGRHLYDRLAEIVA